MSTPEPNYNVAPTAAVPIVRHREGVRCLDRARWGLVPSWAKSTSIGAKMINARSETVTTKNAFRAAAKRRRCIVPADAFYEWTAVANPAGGKPLKQPWCIRRRDGEPLAFAGLFEVWRDPEGEPDQARLLSCTVLTTGANTAMSQIHDRMPVLLPSHRWDSWLDLDNDDITALLATLEPPADGFFEIYSVDTAVNNSRSRGRELMDPAPTITEREQGPDQERDQKREPVS